MGDDELPAIGELEKGHTARVEYISKRSKNPVEREGEVAEVKKSEKGNPMVYIHDEKKGFFRHTFVALVHAVTTEGNRCIAAVSISTEPEVAQPDEPPKLGRSYRVTHSVARRQTLGVVDSVIRVTPEAIIKNEVL